MQLRTLAIRNSWRNRTRAILTILGVMVAVTAFGFLRTVIDAYYLGVEAAATDRLVTRNYISFVISLPIAYRDKIAKVPGVTTVASGNWFGGIYIDEKNFFANFAVDSEPYFRLYPEYQLSPDEKQAYLADRTGAVVGAKLAARFGWKVGQTVTLKGTIFPGDWKFTIRGIYQPRDKSTDATLFFFHWKYLNEGAPVEMRDKAGLYFVGISDPRRSAEIARAIDTQFKGSDTETLTESEKAFQLGFIGMASAIIAALKIVSAFVMLIVALILGNTIAMSVRERSSEIAILKAVGFRGSRLAWLITGESAFIGALGGVAAIALATPLVRFFGRIVEDNVGSLFPDFNISKITLVLMFGLSVVIGLIAALLPALRVARQSTASTLRTLG